MTKCFVVMPFSGSQGTPRDTAYWTRFYKDYVKQTVEELGLACERSNASARSIVGSIVADLYDSPIVLAVLTDHNPNVFYEIGVRHALARGTIMAIEHDQRIPFDLQDYGVIHYERNNRAQFKRDLNRVLNDLATKMLPDNPVAGFLAGHSSTKIRIARDVEETELSTSGALHLAESDILIVGQNLFNLTNDETRDRVFAALLAKPRLSIRIMYADSRDKVQIAALSESVDAAISAQMPRIDKTFREWLKVWRRNQPHDVARLKIHRCRNIGNVSGTVVDGNSQTGCIMIRPVLYHSQPRARPAHWFRKYQAPSVFEAYWSGFAQIWSHSEPLA